MDDLPAHAFWNHLQVVVRGTEHFQGVQFANTCWDPIEIQLVAIDVEFTQMLQTTQRALIKDSDSIT